MASFALTAPKLSRLLSQPPPWYPFTDHVRADLSIRGGLVGVLCLRLRFCAGGLGRNFESFLVHIESLLSVQAFHELAGRLTHRSREIRRFHFDRRFRCSFISILIAKLHLKRLHFQTPFSDHEKLKLVRAL